ncbi:MAG: LacI family DNA-binding transcriptional regulator [Pseudomonadota bacterium]
MPDDEKPPTLHDVANLAGVSTATVSRCLNTPDKVVAETRDRVIAAVQSLGYTPNFAARAMAARRSHTIGAVIPTMDNAIFARGLQSFEEELTHHGYTLLVASSAYQTDREEQQIRALAARGADGLLLIGHDRSPEIYAFLAQRQIPAVISWAFKADAPVPCTGFDNRAGMRALATDVLAQGHRKLGMIAGITKGNDRALQRVKGAQEALVSAGLTEDDLQVIEARYDVEAAKAALLRLMAQPDDRPTAVLCGNDILAVGALRGAEDLGLRVPEDLSITGFDDLEFAHLVSPTLTTVHVPHRAMGQQAARTLIQMLRTGETPSSVELPTAVRHRGSLGPGPEAESL